MPSSLSFLKCLGHAIKLAQRLRYMRRKDALLNRLKRNQAQFCRILAIPPGDVDAQQKTLRIIILTMATKRGRREGKGCYR
jgi:hypothetical protein